MNDYLDNTDTITKEYFKILSPDFPQWLIKYVNVPEMQRL